MLVFDLTARVGFDDFQFGLTVDCLLRVLIRDSILHSHAILDSILYTRYSCDPFLTGRLPSRAYY